WEESAESRYHCVNGKGVRAPAECPPAPRTRRGSAGDPKAYRHPPRWLYSSATRISAPDHQSRHPTVTDTCDLRGSVSITLYVFRHGGMSASGTAKGVQCTHLAHKFTRDACQSSDNQHRQLVLVRGETVRISSWPVVEKGQVQQCYQQLTNSR